MNLFVKLSVCSLWILFCFTSSASYASGMGDWTQKFPLRNGGFILHEPHQININNSFFVGNTINLNGVILKVNMRRSDFIYTLLSAGMVTLEDYAQYSE